MIHARIDKPEHRKIVGFESGTRAQFDVRHGGDPYWVFLDSYRVKYRADFSYFLRYPWKYIIDSHGDIHLTDEAAIVDVEVVPNAPPGYYLLIGRDGQYLKGADGYYLLGYDGDYTPPPEGEVYLTDPDGYFLKDPDQAFITELDIDTNGPTMYITDGGYTPITDGEGGPLITDGT